MMRRSILLLFSFFVCALLGHAAPYEVQDVQVLTVSSAITPATFDYLKNNLGPAAGKKLSVIKLNTPGGLVSTTKEIISLFSQGQQPIVVWVTPEGASAASAGAIIASGAHFIYMAPGTNMGAATPVGLGSDIQEGDSRKKALSDLTATVRSLCELRGRPAKPFEEMIRDARSFTDQEALKAGIIDGVNGDLRSLLKNLNGKNWKTGKETLTLAIRENVTITTVEPSLGQKILEVLANPSTAYFLFLLGAALIYFELQSPGGFIAGAIGAGLLVLAAIAFQVLPLDWGAFGLILVGVVCLVLEVYITSYGLLGLAGVTAIVLGSLFLFQGEGGFISIQYPILLSTLLGILVPMAFITWFVLKDLRKKKDPPHFFVPLESDGTVTGKNRNHYQVKVRGEIWNAQSSDELSPGDGITVVSVDDKKLILTIKKRST